MHSMIKENPSQKMAFEPRLSNTSKPCGPLGEKQSRDRMVVGLESTKAREWEHAWHGGETARRLL